jgi:hypothetical protein
MQGQLQQDQAEEHFGQQQPAGSQHQFQSQLPQRQPQQDRTEERIGQQQQQQQLHDQCLQFNGEQQQQQLSNQQQIPELVSSSHQVFEKHIAPPQDQRQEELSQGLEGTVEHNADMHPLGHPKNKIGCKRAKKIQQLERQVAQTTSELKKVVAFQSKVMSDAVEAAKMSVVDFFSDFRQQVVDNVVERIELVEEAGLNPRLQHQRQEWLPLANRLRQAQPRARPPKKGKPYRIPPTPIRLRVEAGFLGNAKQPIQLHPTAPLANLQVKGTPLLRLLASHRTIGRQGDRAAGFPGNARPLGSRWIKATRMLQPQISQGFPGGNGEMAKERPSAIRPAVKDGLNCLAA